MTTLLRIDCSARITGSHSRQLADYFEKCWKIAHPDGIIKYRDLAQKQLPHIQNNTIEGFYTSPEQMTTKIKNATALSDELIEELRWANEILISSPLYNLNIPSNLKAYFDQVVRVGHTFDINESGYYGLLTNKTAHLVTAKGGIYKGSVMEKYDFQEAYLPAILSHMGIRTANTFSLEGTSNEELQSTNASVLKNHIKQSFNSIEK